MIGYGKNLSMNLPELAVQRDQSLPLTESLQMGQDKIENQLGSPIRLFKILKTMTRLVQVSLFYYKVYGIINYYM